MARFDGLLYRRVILRCLGCFRQVRNCQCPPDQPSNNQVEFECGHGAGQLNVGRTERCGRCAEIPHSRTNPGAIDALDEARIERAAARRRARRHITVTEDGFGFED